MTVAYVGALQPVPWSELAEGGELCAEPLKLQNK